MAFEQFLNSVNQYPDKISNGYAKFAYAVFAQAPLNVLVKLSELVTTPPAIFAAHMRKNQTNKKNGFAAVKNRFALTLKSPLDIFTGLIKAALFIPAFVIKATNELLFDYLKIISNKVLYENSNAFVKFLVSLSALALAIPSFVLGIVDSLLLGKSGASPYIYNANIKAAADTDALSKAEEAKAAYEKSTDWSVAGALSLVERSINAVVSFAARVVAEIVLSPVTLGLFIYKKATTPSKATAPSVAKAKTTASNVKIEEEEATPVNQTPVKKQTAAAEDNVNPQEQAPVTQTPVTEQKEEATHETTVNKTYLTITEVEEVNEAPVNNEEDSVEENEEASVNNEAPVKNQEASGPVTPPVLFSPKANAAPKEKELEEKSDLVESAAELPCSESPKAPQRRRSSSSLSNV